MFPFSKYYHVKHVITSNFQWLFNYIHFSPAALLRKSYQPFLIFLNIGPPFDFVAPDPLHQNSGRGISPPIVIGLYGSENPKLIWRRNINIRHYFVVASFFVANFLKEKHKSKEFRFCHKLWFSKPYIFTTRLLRPLIFQNTNSKNQNVYL